MNHLHLKPIAWTFSLATLISYVICVLWGLTTPDAWHMHGFLEMVLPGFVWLTPKAFVLGLLESFLWGTYFALLLVPLFNITNRRWGCGQEGSGSAK